MNHEKALLSQILQKNDIFYHAQPQGWWFLSPKNQQVFNAISSVLQDSTTADIISIGDKIGDMSYASELSSFVPTTANWKHYAEECRRYGTANEYRKMAEAITTAAKTGDVAEAERLIDETADRVASGSEYSIISLKDKLPEIINEIEERYKNRGVLPGISSGYKSLDDIIDGFQKQRLYVIGARPSQGKSGLMLNLASHIAQDKPVGILTLESSWKEIAMREISGLSGINSQALSRGFFKESGFAKLMQAGEDINKRSIFLYDRPNCSLSDVIGQARRMVHRHKIEILFIDYLHLIEIKADSVRDRVAAAAKRAKGLARELNIPVVALSQLKRDSEGRRPGLGDFSDSSEIEKSIDVGILIYHKVIGPDGKKVAKSKPDTEDSLQIFLLVDKNRDGRTGGFEVYFDKERVQFREKRT